MMLTAAAAMTALIAPAGAGKSHTMAGFARLWTIFTGRRVIGLTTSTNTARVLAHEGLAESYNIAQFLGKVEGSDELRRPVPLHQDDVLVLDEASQLVTADLAMIQEAARQAGARVIATGDTAQLGAVETGGMFRLLAQEATMAIRPPSSRSARPRNGRAEPATCSPCGPPPNGKPCTPRSMSGSRPGSPNPRPSGTTASTPARPCTSGSAPPSSPGTASMP